MGWYQRRVHGELSSLCGAIMNRFVVLAACVCASSAQQVLVGGIAGAYNPAPSTQFHGKFHEYQSFSNEHSEGRSLLPYTLEYMKTVMC